MGINFRRYILLALSYFIFQWSYAGVDLPPGYQLIGPSSTTVGSTESYYIDDPFGDVYDTDWYSDGLIVNSGPDYVWVQFNSSGYNQIFGEVYDYYGMSFVDLMVNVTSVTPGAPFGSDEPMGGSGIITVGATPGANGNVQNLLSIFK